MCILVATSGDTGKAALEGLQGRGSRPRSWCSTPRTAFRDIQQLQMVTQEGDNVGVCAVAATLTMLRPASKRLFSDESLREKLAQRGYFLSSANSINWGRVLPQIVYYISAYCDLLARGRMIRSGTRDQFLRARPATSATFCPPSTPRRWVVPIGRLHLRIQQQQRPDRLHRAPARTTATVPSTTRVSPSMDILISSNLERLLYLLSGGDDKLVAGYMKELSDTGCYQVSEEMRKKIQSVVCGRLLQRSGDGSHHRQA